MKFLLIVLSLGLASCGPAKSAKEEAVHYDQRQNGTENYRVNIDGVLVAVAPAEAVLQAVSSSDFSQILDLIDYDSAELLPPKPVNLNSTLAGVKDSKEPAPEKQGRDKPKRVGLRKRLASIILPLLRRNRNE